MSPTVELHKNPLMHEAITTQSHKLEARKMPLSYVFLTRKTLTFLWTVALVKKIIETKIIAYLFAVHNLQISSLYCTVILWFF